MPSDIRAAETHVLLKGEAATSYCWDFQDEPVVTAGETLSSPAISITNGDALVTMGAPLVLTADFTELDRNGNTIGNVPIGKGVKAAITPLTVKGQCTVTVTVLASGGSRIAKQVIFQVK